MRGVWSVLATFGATVLLWLFWFVVVIVIPGLIAVYVSMLFPLRGQWRKKWVERHNRALDAMDSTLPVHIRLATPDDAAAIWAIVEPAIRAGETYALDQTMSRDAALSYWLSPEKDTFVAERNGVVVGTYFMRPNQAGGGSHVCNCGYMTHPEATGRGVARAMCQHSLQHARELGYRAMQFNFVVSTNERAVRLWESLGFQTVGRLPLAFRHPRLGFVDALVMFRTL